jgi:predicted nucleotidyltransferase
MRRERIPDDESQYGERSSVFVRGTLLNLTLEFVRAARMRPEVQRIPLLGSLVTDKSRPKDVDLLVAVDRDADLAGLARLGRRLQGKAQQINSTADVFVCNEDFRYLGRICHFRECFPRGRCLARNCGAKPGLADDLDAIMLPKAVLKDPPLVLYPSLSSFREVPADVIDLLVKPLQATNAATQ